MMNRTAQKNGNYDAGEVTANPCRWDNAWDFSEGFAVVVKNNKYGFIDKSGRILG